MSFLKNVFGIRAKAAKPTTASRERTRIKPQLEALEDRRMMSVSTTFNASMILIQPAPGSTTLRARVTEGYAYNPAIGRMADAYSVTDLDTNQVMSIFKSSLKPSAYLEVNATSASCNFLEFDNQTNTLQSWVFGSQGHDIIRGGQRGDYLDGGNGNDTIEGRGGNDTILGGSGSDTHVFAGWSLGHDWILEDTSGRNKLDFSGALSGVKVNLGTTVPQTVIQDGPYIDLVLEFSNSNAISDVLGSRFSDVIEGNERDNVLEGHDGDDTLKGFGGVDTLKGGNGMDTLFGGEQRDYLYGENDVDYLYGENGDDYLNGGTAGAPRDGQADHLWGGAGYDTFDAEYESQWTWRGREVWSVDYLDDWKWWEDGVIQNYP